MRERIELEKIGKIFERIKEKSKKQLEELVTV